MVLFSGVTAALPAESAAATASRGREGGRDIRRTKSPDYSLTFLPTPPPLPPPPPRPAFNQHVNKRKVIFFLKRSGGDKGSRGVVNPLDTLMEEFVPVMLGPLIMQGCISVRAPPLAVTTAHRSISPSSSFALGFPALFHSCISKKHIQSRPRIQEKSPPRLRACHHVCCCCCCCFFSFKSTQGEKTKTSPPVINRIV